MKPLARDDLLGLEAYARERTEFRNRVMAHKRPRRVRLGAHMMLVFEDRLTMQFQVQEMLRAERIFEPAGIQDELDAYNPLVPDGTNLKATLLLEYPDPQVRRRELRRLRNVEHHVHLQVGELERVHAVADEDLQRSDAEKTSAVHFLRFELSDAMRSFWRDGAPVHVGCSHASCGARVRLDGAQHAALLADFD